MADTSISKRIGVGDHVGAAVVKSQFVVRLQDVFHQTVLYKITRYCYI